MTEKEELEKLRELVKEYEQSARMLVRRDVELSKANERLRELDRMKSEFVSVAAHQLRTPLSAVKWALKILIDGDVGELTSEQQSVLLKGYESNERMVRLVDDLLSVDRIESGKLRYEMSPAQITDLISNVISEISSRAESHNVKLNIVAPKKEPPPVYIDTDKIRVVLQNLLDNAIKYTMSGGTVTVGVTEKDDAIEVSVSDTGIGIPKEQQGQLFSKFFRGTNAVRVETGGTGLGLFIARRIIEHHGGKIWFESEEGKGTTFYFAIPKQSDNT